MHITVTTEISLMHQQQKQQINNMNHKKIQILLEINPKRRPNNNQLAK